MAKVTIYSGVCGFTTKVEAACSLALPADASIVFED